MKTEANAGKKAGLARCSNHTFPPPNPGFQQVSYLLLTKLKEIPKFYFNRTAVQDNHCDKSGCFGIQTSNFTRRGKCSWKPSFSISMGNIFYFCGFKTSVTFLTGKELSYDKSFPSIECQKVQFGSVCTLVRTCRFLILGKLFLNDSYSGYVSFNVTLNPQV